MLKHARSSSMIQRSTRGEKDESFGSQAAAQTLKAFDLRLDWRRQFSLALCHVWLLRMCPRLGWHYTHTGSLRRTGNLMHLVHLILCALTCSSAAIVLLKARYKEWSFSCIVDHTATIHHPTGRSPSAWNYCCSSCQYSVEACWIFLNTNLMVPTIDYPPLISNCAVYCRHLES